MTRMTITLCLVTAAVTFIGCSSGPEPAEAQPEPAGEATPVPASEAESTTAPPEMTMPARVGMIRVKDALERQLEELSQLDVDELLEQRWKKFDRMGEWLEAVAT